MPRRAKDGRGRALALVAATLATLGCPGPTPVAPPPGPSPASPTPAAAAPSTVDASALDATLPAGWVDEGYWAMSRTFSKKGEGPHLNVVTLDEFPDDVPFEVNMYGEILLRDPSAAKTTLDVTEITEKTLYIGGWLLKVSCREAKDRAPGPAFVMLREFPGTKVRAVGHSFADEPTRQQGISLVQSLRVPANLLDLGTIQASLPEGWTKDRKIGSAVTFRKMLLASEFHANGVAVDRLPKSAPRGLEEYVSLVTTKAPQELTGVVGNSDDFAEVTEKKALPKGWYFVGKVRALTGPPRPAFVLVVDVNGTKVRARSEDMAPELMSEALEVAKSVR